MSGFVSFHILYICALCRLGDCCIEYRVGFACGLATLGKHGVRPEGNCVVTSMLFVLCRKAR